MLILCAVGMLAFVALASQISSPYMPHAMCWRGDEKLIAANFSVNMLIFLAYMVISAMLLWLDRTFRLINKRFIFLAFACFIFLCGVTHLMDIVLLWYPLYWLDASIRVLCALASAVTAFVVIEKRRAVHAVLIAIRRTWSVEAA